MATITTPSLTLRNTKGSPLTSTEVDANFTNISAALATGLTAASYTAADVLAKLITVDGINSGLDADLIRGAAPSSANVVSTVVTRDASGNFSANAITATSFSGTHSGTASLTSGTITGLTSLGASGVAITSGTISGITSFASSSVTITGGTISGLSAAIPVLSGGTGATTASAARTNLGLVIGTDVPSPTGTGASGTWSINITGTAGTVPTATAATQIANTGGWNITPTGTTLYFNYNGTNVGSLDSSGNFKVIGEITSNTTV